MDTDSIAGVPLTCGQQSAEISAGQSRGQNGDKGYWPQSIHVIYWIIMYYRKSKILWQCQESNLEPVGK